MRLSVTKCKVLTTGQRESDQNSVKTRSSLEIAQPKKMVKKLKKMQCCKISTHFVNVLSNHRGPKVQGIFMLSAK